jgi:hypothetical protein
MISISGSSRYWIPGSISFETIVEQDDKAVSAITADNVFNNLKRIFRSLLILIPLPVCQPEAGSKKNCYL